MRKYLGKIIRCTNDGKIFRSASAAARYYGINQGNICQVCRGRKADTCGFSFEYVKPTREIILELREEAKNEA